MYTVNHEIDRVMRSVFRRCVECSNDSLECQACPAGTSCSFSVQTCDTCSRAECVADSIINPGADQAVAGPASEGPNIGAIAGGVIGGIAFIAFATYLVWRFCIKGRRQEYDDREWEETDMSREKRQTQFTMRRDARMSTHTVASMASSVLTRASNIIQIAYIPGITNRSGPQSPDLLVPPVPPLPMHLNNSGPSSPYSATEDSHYFMPGDLRSVRGSTYSGMSGMTGMTGFSDDRRSSFQTMHSRHSITPSLARSSVATTIYRNDAVLNPMPAQTIVRGKAAVVSVKSAGSGNSPLGTPNSGTPPLPQSDFDRIQIQGSAAQLRMPASNNSLRPSESSVVSTATTAKPIPFTVSMKKPSLISMNSNSSLKSGQSTSPNRQSDAEMENDPPRARRSIRNSNTTEIADTPSSSQSPFADMSATITSPDFMPRSASRLDTVDETEESQRASAHMARSRSPFGDEHEMR